MDNSIKFSHISQERNTVKHKRKAQVSENVDHKKFDRMKT